MAALDWLGNIITDGQQWLNDTEDALNGNASTKT
jgi:hypothetical protein